MTVATNKSFIQSFLENRAKETGKTIQEVLAEERARARRTDTLTEDCLLPDEALELIRAGVRYVNQELAMVELPPLYKETGEHVKQCNLCKTFIGIMALSHPV